jgi:hypothetical protein
MSRVSLAAPTLHPHQFGLTSALLVAFSCSGATPLPGLRFLKADVAVKAVYLLLEISDLSKVVVLPVCLTPSAVLLLSSLLLLINSEYTDLVSQRIINLL